MRRLCTDSSCSYSGRSARYAAEMGYGSRTEGHSERCGVSTGPLPPVLGSALCGNAERDRAEVSRGHTSRDIQEGAAVKGRTRKYKEEP